jgi:hypothetical protein
MTAFVYLADESESERGSDGRRFSVKTLIERLLNKELGDKMIDNSVLNNSPTQVLFKKRSVFPKHAKFTYPKVKLPLRLNRSLKVFPLK